MSGDAMKDALHDELRWVRAPVLGTLDGLTEDEVRRPVTRSGTSLLGLIRHLTLTEAVYLGDCFGRPFPEPHPRSDDPGFRNRDSLRYRRTNPGTRCWRPTGAPGVTPTGPSARCP